MNQQCRKAGFTLIELIVVIGIMGVVTGMGCAWFIRMTDLWRDARDRVELDRRADAIFELMGRDFAAAVSPRLSGVPLGAASRTAKEESERYMMDLPDDSVVIPVLTPKGSAAAQVGKRVMYHVDRDKDSGALVRSVGDLSGEMPDTGGQVIADGVVGMRIEYADGSGKEKWQASWSAASMPTAVRVSITLTTPVTRREQVSRKAVFSLNVS